jgi:hypothetical protein
MVTVNIIEVVQVALLRFEASKRGTLEVLMQMYNEGDGNAEKCCNKP